MTPRSLQLADGLRLPLDAVSRTFGILAVRGAGKSNTAAVMAEEMFGAGLPFVVIDPVGSWYGLRSSADGTAPGLPIPIFGGKHGDVPLERGAGELVADLVVEKRLTCVLDLSRFDTESDKKAFLLAFARRLYLKNENPLHLFLEEADDYIPQSPMGDEKHLLRAWENIVRRGRARGLGMTLITQRSAAVAKMVLTQVETLFAMRTTGPQDIAAIEAWVKYHQVGKDVLSTLASLDDGEAWVWSPHYLKTMARHQIRRRQTFDSGATPKNVRAKDTRPPATLADIDLAQLQDRMAATIEKAKADDPKELRRQVADLQRQLEIASRPKPNVEPVEKREVPVLTDADRQLLTEVGQRLHALAASLTLDLEALTTQIRTQVAAAVNTATADTIRILNTGERDAGAILTRVGFNLVLEKLAAVARPVTSSHTSQVTPRHPADTRAGTPGRSSAATRPAEPRAPRVSDGPDVAGRLTRAAERKALTVLAQYPQGRTVRQVAILAGYAMNGGGFRNALGRLRALGYIEGRGDALTATDAGLDALGSFDPLPTGRALADHWLRQLDRKAEREILQVLLDAYPKALTAEQIAAATPTQYEPNGGGFRNALGKLRTLELIDGRGELRASEELVGSDFRVLR